mgnify:CR=1 FL=1
MNKHAEQFTLAGGAGQGGAEDEDLDAERGGGQQPRRADGGIHDEFAAQIRALSTSSIAALETNDIAALKADAASVLAILAGEPIEVASIELADGTGLALDPEPRGRQGRDLQARVALDPQRRDELVRKRGLGGSLDFGIAGVRLAVTDIFQRAG